MDNKIETTRKVLVVDDHSVTRDGIDMLVQGMNEFSETLQAASTAEALAIIENELPDMVITDLSMPDRNGLELVRDTIARFPDTKFLVLSMHDESLYAERALRAGAKGYLMKDASSTELENAIRTIIKGDIYVSPNIGSVLLQRLSGRKGNDNRNSVLQVLSDRELQVFEMVGQALSNQAIADKLNITARTVDAHKTRLKEKLQISDNNALLRFAVRWLEGEAALKSGEQ